MDAVEHRKLLLSFGRRRGDSLNAEALQQGIIDREAEQVRMGIDYPDEHVRLATVHMRQDLVLAISYLTAINGRLRTIQWALIILGAMFLWRFG